MLFRPALDDAFSIVVDMDRLQPDGWETKPVPTIRNPTDEVIYEMHVRDFTINDETTPTLIRGKYLGLVHTSPADRNARRAASIISRVWA